MRQRLAEAEIARWCAAARLSVVSTLALTGLGARLQDEPELLAAVGELYQTLYCTQDDPNPAMARVTALAGPRVGTVNALLILLSIPLVASRQRARGVPAEITRAVNERHAIGWLRSLDDPGPVSVTDWHPLWFRTVASGRLYRAGGLEFEPTGFRHPFEVWRQRTGEATVLVAEDGVRLSADGFLTGDLSWTSRRQERDGALVANPVLPTGGVRRAPVRLPLADWHRVLARGGPVLDLHVPERAELTVAGLADALHRAWELARQFHPEHHAAGFVCASWLFCPHLDDILRAADGAPATGRDSRILRWQEEGYLFPDDAADGSFLNWTFGARSIDPAAAPRDSRLRRGALRRLEAGQPLRSGGWLLLAADRARFGQRPYRDSSTATIVRTTIPTVPVAPG